MGQRPVVPLEWLYFLVLLGSISLVLSQEYSTTVRVRWNGATSHCGSAAICQTPGATYDNGSFACSDGNHGIWANGTRSFIDPLPHDDSYLVMQVKLVAAGRYNCDNQTNPTISFFLQSGLISQQVMPLTPFCFCPHCVIPVNITSTMAEGGWPGYNYNKGNNTITATILGTSVCLSYVDVTLVYARVHPVISSLLPGAGFLQGGSEVSIFGPSFDSSIDHMCVFGSQTANATYLSPNHLSCTSPAHNEPGLVALNLLIPANNYVIQTSQQFLYYIEPNITELLPNAADCDGISNITIRGDGFINLPSMRCVWNSTANFGHVINDSYAICTTPTGPRGDMISGNLWVKVSENSQDYTNELLFYCKEPPPPSTNPSEVPGWIWVVSLFGGSMILVILILYGTRRFLSKKGPDEDDSFESKRLLNDSFIKQIDIRDIQIGERIGKGTFGEVYKGVWNGTECGVKYLTAPAVNEQFLADFYKEVNIMRSLRHPNVLQFLGASTSTPDVCIIMEFMPFGSLFKILHDDSIKLDLEMIRRMMLDAARGMNYLHKSDPMIIHRDLKSHNLLVDENWKVKVCDFGLSKILENQSDYTTMTACGTPSWTAPEILRNEKYTEKGDVYSFGIVLWECISREDPYAGMPPFQVVLAVGTRQMRPVIPDGCKPEWADLMTKCWAEDQDARPTMSEVMTKLEQLGE